MRIRQISRLDIDQQTNQVCQHRTVYKERQTERESDQRWAPANVDWNWHICRQSRQASQREMLRELHRPTTHRCTNHSIRVVGSEAFSCTIGVQVDGVYNTLNVECLRARWDASVRRRRRMCYLPSGRCGLCALTRAADLEHERSACFARNVCQPIVMFVANGRRCLEMARWVSVWESLFLWI